MNAAPRGIGLDPGTISFGLCGLEGEEVFLDQVVPTAEVAADPEILLGIIRRAGGADCIVGPSGYGLPWVKAGRLTREHIRLMLLPARRDRGREVVIGGMERLLLELKRSGLPVVFGPGVVHLESVPAHRKTNRIDMGTADKVCAAALGVYDQAGRLGIHYRDTSFLQVEMGGAFTAVLAVDQGRIVDGAGGTAGPMGYRAHGAMDGELAYLLGAFSKDLLCSGGAVDVAGRSGMDPADWAEAAESDPRAAMALDAYAEGLAKAVAAAMVAVPEPREVLLSGRLCWEESLFWKLAGRLTRFAPVRRVAGFARAAKEAAQGAALMAEGLAGGRFQKLLETMQLTRASGTVLDHIHLPRARDLERALAGGRRAVPAPETGELVT